MALADLMELWCPNEDCEARRLQMIDIVKDELRKGEYGIRI